MKEVVKRKIGFEIESGATRLYLPRPFTNGHKKCESIRIYCTGNKPQNVYITFNLHTPIDDVIYSCERRFDWCTNRIVIPAEIARQTALDAFTHCYMDWDATKLTVYTTPPNWSFG